eukprot:TRINITY_DN772_c0_g1_i1.p1 TRINITY_DN772_c0_g1~~TRINITY_DN772_c0_g1_i1.p1  ORF type:complete len:598 (+),score=110.78 TRINITY_DN772_c0_g1_i1:476-2269(+)
MLRYLNRTTKRKRTTAPKLRQHSYYQQAEPRLGNQYQEDAALLSVMHRRIPTEMVQHNHADLCRFGDRVTPAGDLLHLARDCEYYDPPVLVSNTAWGRREDKIRVSPSWKALGDISAEEGLIALGYERKFGEYSRLFQFIKLYLFTPSSSVYQCPLAMADGAARLIELNMDSVDKRFKSKIKESYDRLTTRDPKQFWTSGQWMTEKRGGSDVSQSETTAELQDDGSYLLNGYKFFTSATTSEITMTLGKIKQNGIVRDKLSTFFVETHKSDGSLNNILVHKLKKKLGTRAVPTAELELVNTPATLIGQADAGVKVISSILNITRIHNATHGLSAMRRIIALARDYSLRRKCFGAGLSDIPLHLRTLADMELELRGTLQLWTDVLILLGRNECGTATDTDNTMLRILTPLLKLYNGKQAISVVSEGLEAIGGTGYMEDSDCPRLLRDVQVGSIWEGTTNILSLDVWRPITKENGLVVFSKEVTDRLKLLDSKFASVASRLGDGLQSLCNADMKLASGPSARSFAFTMTNIYIGLLLAEQANWSKSELDAATTNMWLAKHPVKYVSNSSDYDRMLALGLDSEKKLLYDVHDPRRKPYHL